jgi:uncharacterized protein YdaU (DUF1376 family)
VEVEQERALKGSFLYYLPVTQTWTEAHRLQEDCTPLAPTAGPSTVKKENSKIQSYLNSFFSRNE